MNKDYINWHYNIAYPQLLTVFSNLFIFPIYFYSIPLHTKTLFSPWKRTIVSKKRGFQLNNIMGVISFNLTSRFLGLIVRSFVIFFALFLCLFLPLIFLPVILIWPFIPGVTYPFYLNKKDPQKELSLFLQLRLPGYPNSKKDDIENVINWFNYLEFQKQNLILLSSKRIRALTGLGTEWAYGYTVNLDKYSRDLTKFIPVYPFLLGRDKELSEIERSLLKNENNNVLIIGEPGTGRHILVSTLAHNLILGHCDPNLAHKRILSLDMHALFAASENHDKLKALFSDLLSEAVQAGNINVYIDDIDKFVSRGDDRVDLTDVLEKFASSRVGLIGTTTPESFHTFIEPNPELSKLFTIVRLSEPSQEVVLKELEFSIVPVLETKYPISITLPALQKIITDSDRFLTSTPFPGKAIELLEESVIYKIKTHKSDSSHKHKYAILLAEDIDSYLSQKLNIPLGELQSQETDKLLHLEDYLHQNVINQHNAIRLIASALRRSRLNISSSKKPIASFLFLGPTGVGKTETAKALNKAWFGGKAALTRFDMSEFQGEAGLTRLIGNPSGTPGELTTKLRESPYGVLLFDEIEKAPQMILNLFLTVLDEGYITDGHGKNVDCRNTIIIATSNAGASYIREIIMSGTPESELNKKVLDHIMAQRLFSPEFINRFEATVVYTPLNEGQLKEVAKLMLNSLNERLKPKEISLDISPALINHLATLGSNLEFGARSIRREIETNIEDQIAQQVLKGQYDKSKPLQIDL